MESTSNILVSIVEDNHHPLSLLSKIIDASDGFRVLSRYANAEDEIGNEHILCIVVHSVDIKQHTI